MSICSGSNKWYLLSRDHQSALRPTSRPFEASAVRDGPGTGPPGASMAALNASNGSGGKAGRDGCDPSWASIAPSPGSADVVEDMENLLLVIHTAQRPNVQAHVAQSYISLDFASDVANGYTMKQVSYTKAAIRALRRMPANTATLVSSKIEAFAQDPGSQANNVKSLQGREGIRLRVGDWRVIMDDHGNVLAVLDIGPRGRIYDGKGMT